MIRSEDGSAGDANYAALGSNYSLFRQPEPRIVSTIAAALGDARSVINIGAGAGSYEPTDRVVTAVEPSASMRSQRPEHLSRAIDATAESLPFPDQFFDAAMATFTIHQWSDLQAGLREIRRVTRGKIVILTCDPSEVQRFWLNEYAPEVLATEARRYPAFSTIRAALAGKIEVTAVPIPLYCRDGFNEAYYGRPEMLLNSEARRSCSAWSFVSDQLTRTYVENLRDALANGHWDGHHGHLRSQRDFTGSLSLVSATPHES